VRWYGFLNSDTLTPREVDVLSLACAGLANKEIARELGIGEKTVKTHVSNILGKLGCTSRAQAAAHAVAQRLATPTST